MVAEVYWCWRRPTRSGIGTGSRLCGGSSAEASVELPWAVSMASVAPVVDGAVAAVVVVAVLDAAVAAAVDYAAVEETVLSG